ncbi:MAG TPA: hypothetical protein VL991_04490 [Terracidiphilus sp.]|nr:hypothetical protein [Terracidiphilus sp.]
MADPLLEQALGNFRQSVHAWSKAAYERPRTAAPIAVHRGWRLAASWALGCVLAAGSLTGALYKYHHRQVIEKTSVAQARRSQQLAVQQSRTNDDEDLLANVDSDISRDVPAAMEPLAQLMESSGDQ